MARLGKAWRGEVGVRLTRTVTEKNRAELARLVELVAAGSQVEIMDSPRSSAQNRLMWTLLHTLADQIEHCGRKYDAETWKCICLKALGKELQFAPGLDGGIVAVGYRSSRLTKEEMANLIEFIYSEGTKRGVVFHGEAA